LFAALAAACVALVSASGAPQQKPGESPPAAKPDAPPPAAPLAEEPGAKAVRGTLAAFAKAYTTANVEALSGVLTDEASVIDSNGDEVRGKAAVVEMYADALEDAPGVKLDAEVEEIRFLTPDVSRAEGRSRLSTGTGDASEFHRFSVLLVRKDNQWRIAEIRDYPLPVEDVTPYERLKELEWMVGEWVDEDADNKVTASIRWADNQSYLVRTYTVELQGQKASSGTMFIGWDPQTGQIKSWLFDSEGGHGEGLWTRAAEDQWVVKAQGVLRDGRPTSATQIHTVVNKDAVKTRSIDRILGGQVAPDVPEILMVRKPPQPSTDAAKPDAPVRADK
jgi:uncharacterized protein (TIGR02246 family)